MCLIELDQIKPIVILHWIVGSGAAIRRTLVMHFTVANSDEAGPQIAVVPRCRVSTRRIISLNAVVRVFRFVTGVAVYSISSGVQFFSSAIAVVGSGKDVESIDYDSSCEMKANVIQDNTVSR